MWPRQPLRFHWVQDGPIWHLEPSAITVRPDGAHWAIYMYSTPLHRTYTSAQGAKLDAWQFAYSKRGVLFSTYGKIKLEV